jgi:hypothetical protein
LGEPRFPLWAKPWVFASVSPGIWLERGDTMMNREKPLRFVSVLAGFFIWAGNARAEDISGTISATKTITEDSRLSGDVTCTVMLAPCISFGASGLTLDLNGFSITGTGPRDAQGACVPVAGSGNEAGVLVTGPDSKGAVIRGPGLVRRFRGSGILITNTTGAVVAGVTATENCNSGIFLGAGSDHLVEGNVVAQNGAPNAPCGGI